MREISAARSTLNFHIAPYASTLLNHVVNLWYAVIRGDPALTVHRVAGIMAQGYYLTTYLTFSAPAKAPDNRRWLQWVAGIVAAIFAWLHIVLPLFNAMAQYNTHIAFFGAVTGVGLAASPLATVVRAGQRRARARVLSRVHPQPCCRLRPPPSPPPPRARASASSARCCAPRTRRRCPRRCA
jgi:hypothetical protein